MKITPELIAQYTELQNAIVERANRIFPVYFTIASRIFNDKFDHDRYCFDVIDGGYVIYRHSRHEEPPICFPTDLLHDEDWERKLTDYIIQKYGKKMLRELSW